ncbi:MAG: isoaspartyl peptidase/L-asparaginase family protein, partial [Nitrospiraceae bacterium]
LVDGHEVLRRGASSVDAVEKTIRVLESSGLFNAGIGSRLQLDRVRRMDASIMEGRTLRAGAVAAIERIRHPISAARLVMEETEHVLLVGEPATRFARYFKLELDRQPVPGRVSFKPVRGQHASGPTQKTRNLYRAMRVRRTAGLETVGAVAMDRSGTVASGASTGGIALMLPGRVGDTPLIGCGVYADNGGGAVSMTGVGEGIIRVAVAKEIVDRLAAGAGPALATRLVLKKLVTRIRGAAGAIVLAPDGRFAIRHTTPRMCAGYWNGTGQPVVADRFR